MDLIRSMPLPPSPQHSMSTGSTRELVQELTGLSVSQGAPHPVKVIPGDLPSVEVPIGSLLTTALYLRDHLEFDMLSSISGVDMMNHFEVVYHLRSIKNNWLMQLKVKLPPNEVEVESVVSVWTTANWHERETFDLFGIVFTGHPDLRRILLDDEFEGYPLRKSFRPSPLTVHDRATTQTDPERAVSGDQSRGLGTQRAVPNLLSQGDQERLHPGTPTFGSTQFHGAHFPPTTWKHTLEHAQESEPDEKK